MKRWLAALLVLLVVSIAAIPAASGYGIVLRHPSGWGSFTPRTGAMKISEESMIDAEVMALKEINQSGGLLGRQVEWVIADGRSDWPTFAREAQRLIDQEKVSVIFGCWTSASRKSVKPVVEQRLSPVDLPDGLRRSGAVAQHRLHGCGTEPAGHSGGELVLRDLKGSEVLPGRLGLRLAALRQRDHQGPAQGA